MHLTRRAIRAAFAASRPLPFPDRRAIMPPPRSTSGRHHSGRTS